MDSYSYTYDDAHNQLTKYEKIRGVEKGTTTYTYDDLNRLETVTEPGTSGKVTTYTCDGAGNRYSETVTQGTNSTQIVYAHNEQNRLITTTATQLNGTQDIVKYNYDNNGNLVYKGKEVVKASTPQDNSGYGLFVVGQSLDDFSTSMGMYEYDDWNQLISARTGDKTEAYVYNGIGYRVQKTSNGQTTRYLYEYDKVILETGEDGTQKAWNVYGTNLISRKMSSDTAFYIYNGHGDVTALLNPAGSVLATYYYDAFGNILEANENAGVNNPFRYVGYQYDQTGLYYLNARYYDSVTARFLSEDTYTGEKNDPLSLNLYTYCRNNPIVYFDPTGHKKEVSVVDYLKKQNEDSSFSARKEIAKELKIKNYTGTAAQNTQMLKMLKKQEEAEKEKDKEKNKEKDKDKSYKVTNIINNNQNTIIPPGGFVVVEPIIESGDVGNFNGISGTTLNNVLSRVPSDATFKPFSPSSTLNDGIRLTWNSEGANYELWAHEANPNAPIGSNSSEGWVVRIRKSGCGNGKWYLNSEGQWIKENVLNPSSPMYDEVEANSTHIKIQNPHDKDDENKKPPTGGGAGGNSTGNNKIIVDESGNHYRLDMEGNLHEGHYDLNGNWHDRTPLDGGMNNHNIYVVPSNPTLPSFNSFLQPVPIFGY